MAKINALLVSLLMLFVAGVARAADVPDAPLPEPNYVAILIFFGLCLGAGIWFVILVVRNKGDDKK